jgi:hypothetical protein
VGKHKHRVGCLRAEGEQINAKYIPQRLADAKDGAMVLAGTVICATRVVAVYRSTGARTKTEDADSAFPV